MTERTTTTPRLVAEHASKTYGAVRVLDDAKLVVERGEIHALIGQNGSGKSTLVKILTGYHAPDAGMTLAVDGRSLGTPVKWQEAQQAGVSVVHQDMGLVDHATVSENIGIGSFRRTPFGAISWRKQDEIAERTLARLGVDIDPRLPVGELSPSHRAAVAIARALKNTVPGQGVVILDEATRALPRADLDNFHTVLQRIVGTGTSVLMVSHNLDEVLKLADRVTVLRDGKVAAAGVSTQGLDESDLARFMLGAAVEAVVRTPCPRDDEPPAAHISGLRIGGGEPFDLTVRAGEIVGITGLPGSGFEELPHYLGGSRQAVGTVITPRGTVDLAETSVDKALAAGMALVPERRITDGLAVELTVRENLALPLLRKRGKWWLVTRKWQDELTEQVIERFRVKTGGGSDLIRALSGGNQQKILLAKWLAVEPSLLVLHEPTQAVDVGARVDLLQAVSDVAATGVGVLMLSTEPADLAETCDRILVITPQHEPRELRATTADDILEAVYGATHV
ncbi:sugar ABC transporter ATP-binding protein [Streptomyces brasiliensis]|uniref:Sugar ABC transporter ATP-binding protein n=1 Tax=Streptomyces brasiliensis TaxID=1954 RepID=A0A917L3E2_9ACTN|nr:sugar ABC transporter ATP-binding protein [Streptomyces brasiliensis]GGJ42855.1 sugar ABC transporter ATP-binding protein [Streptomyces brasiliensis]